MLPIHVNFYVLKNEEPAAKWLVACRLVEKAYLKGHRVYVHCPNQQDAECLDEMLWTFKEDSFIPHNLQGEGPEPPPPVQIGFNKDPRGFEDILINLAHDVPSFFMKFKRIMEIVSHNEQEKEQSRAHYRIYKQHGCDLHTHPLGDNAKKPVPTDQKET